MPVSQQQLSKIWSLLIVLVVTLVHYHEASMVQQKHNLTVRKGRSAFLHSRDLVIEVPEDGSLCKVQVEDNDPMTQRVGKMHPKVC